MAINAPLKRNCFTSTRSANTIAAKHQPKQPQELTSYSSLAMRGGRGTYPAQKGIKRARNRCGFKLAVVGERELDSAVSNQGKREKRKAQQQTETEPETKSSTLFLLVYFVFRGADGARTAQTQGGGD